MVLKLILAIVPILLVLVVSEYLWRSELVRGERARKFVHILAGCWVAFWPWLMTMDMIALVGVGAIVVQYADRRLKIFHSTIDVPRRSLGDLLFPAGVAVTALIATDNWVFAVVVLHLALADGLAAVIGQLFGQNNHYQIFESRKSVTGTATFIFISYVLMGVLIAALHISSAQSLATLLLLPPLLAATENIAPYGLDNLVVPLIAASVLQSVV